MFALYIKATGLIQSTANRLPTDAAQIAELDKAGYGLVEVPDNVNGSNAYIDVATGQAIQFNAAPPPVPHIFVQYIAAQINAGVLSAAAFHPVTLVEMSAQLSAANMNAIVTAPAELAVAKGPATVG